MKSQEDANTHKPPSFAQQLLAWFDLHGRHDLPWQQPKTPYRVWVSEIMLQQTQVQTVIAYFERFMLRFPKLQDLANASQDEVLAHWSGLGYYARGRNLHKAAQMIVAEHAGVFPQSYDEIVALPGIGRSTASAILSIAFGQNYAILDGNVKRVLSRYDAVETWPGEKQTEQALWKRAQTLMDTPRAGDYTQAIMDLGATLCRRSRPDCGSCPVSDGCKAYARQAVVEFPRSKPKTIKPTREAYMLLALNSKQQIFLQKRPQKGIWGGLWSLPQFETEQQLCSILGQDTSEAIALEALPLLKHSFTHYHLEIHPRVFKMDSSSGLAGQWLSVAQALEMGLPAPIRKLIEKTEKIYVKECQLRKNG